MPHVDENAFTSACAHADVNQEVLRSLILNINERYTDMKIRKDDSAKAFYTLLTTTLRDDVRIDLLTFFSYKAALAKYYGTKRHIQALQKKLPYKMDVEKKTSTEARIKVSDGLSLVFRSLRSVGKLIPTDVEYIYHISDTHHDVGEGEMLTKARKRACAAMNTLRKTKKHRKAA